MSRLPSLAIRRGHHPHKYSLKSEFIELPSHPEKEREREREKKRERETNTMIDLNWRMLATTRHQSVNSCYDKNIN